MCDWGIWDCKRCPLGLHDVTNMMCRTKIVHDKTPFFLKKYKTLSNNIWRYIKELHKRHYISGQILIFHEPFIIRKKKPNQVGLQNEWKYMPTRIFVFNCIIFYATINLTWRTVFEKHIPMYILYKGHFSSLILAQMCPVACVMCCRLCYVYTCIKHIFHAVKFLRQDIYTFVWYL